VRQRAETLETAAEVGAEKRRKIFVEPNEPESETIDPLPTDGMIGDGVCSPRKIRARGYHH